MKRFKKHVVKVEKPEASASHSRHVEEYDLTYYIHDRVELMHQVFSVLKHKDLKAMAPECVRHISIDDLQELCTEELLGISSKRLCAILDGAEPPSDTDSSSESPERMETISLDSISSDEEILSETSSRKGKKHKRHRRDSKSKPKKKKNKEDKEEESADAELSRASRAGLTVLELLELQARARAIRAQLQQEQAAKQAAEPVAVQRHSSSDNEVEIKEEPAEVVEISSEDEKPNFEELNKKASSKTKGPEKNSDTTDTQTVTKRVSDLIITVPQVKQSRKIKLNRSKLTVSLANSDKTSDKTTNNVPKTKETPQKAAQNKNKEAEKKKEVEKAKESNKKSKEKELKVKDKKKKVKKSNKANPDSDHDEITLQLSDTEKMDLLEDLDRKNFDNLSSSDSEDSESSSSDSASQSSEGEASKDNAVKENNRNNKKKHAKVTEKDPNTKVIKDVSSNIQNTNENSDKASNNAIEMRTDKEVSSDKQSQEDVISITDEKVEDQKDSDNNETQIKVVSDNQTDSNEKAIEITTIDDIPVVNETNDEIVSVTSNDTSQDSTIIDAAKSYLFQEPNTSVNGSQDTQESPDENTNRQKSPVSNTDGPKSPDKNTDKERSTVHTEGRTSPVQSKDTDKTIQIKNIDSQATSDKELSDGELTDKESSDVEAVELKPEVVCISDDETDKKAHKKKKKKEKKSKSKKSKKSKQDFREGGDQNFFKETREDTGLIEKDIDEIVKIEEDDDCDDVYEILELSDDSSCYEVEGTVLSKEPTAEEIEALSAKIDEIEREDVVTEEEIRAHENRTKDSEELENISWKDRYLDSNKVKKVLSTSSIFNALRKKNRELKKKIEESKKKEEEVETNKEESVEPDMPIEEGSIEQYQTLQGSTKFVDPVPEIVENTNKEDDNDTSVQNKEEKQTEQTKELRKDAKQLLKMYKRLMKYNDMNKQKKKDPNKKKKKKSKKNKEVTNTVVNSTV